MTPLIVGMVIVVAAALYAIREGARYLDGTSLGVEFEGMFSEVYAKAPESAFEDVADGEGR